ncbi:uncharacterized protein LOC126574655 [Anopheles aquasalis]|uniref:Putative secreted protein n=1 Tax=Anopheles aquasalis TaxID=42839 RepID=T1E7Q5_ANOAQ|nr:uncharacterized protein LOC126574655 [Anopheles aquasalis]
MAPMRRISGSAALLACVVLCCVVSSRLCLAGPIGGSAEKDDEGVTPKDSSKENNGHSLNSLYSPAEYGAPSVGISSEEVLSINETSVNGTKELYVIKAVVYEIGILADVPENETLDGDEPETHQQVDLSFFSHGENGTHIDFGDIPVPIQTSIQGQVFTGIAPVHVGAVPTNLTHLLSALPIAGTVVNISQSNSSFVELHKHNISDAAVLLAHPDLVNMPFASSVSEPLVPASVDETVLGLTASSSTTSKPPEE